MRVACAAFIVSLLATTSAMAEEPIVLRMAAIAPEGTGWARELKALSRDLESMTNGGVVMKWYLGGIAGDEATALQRIRRGQLDGAAGALFCGSLSKTLEVTRLAGLVQSRDESLYLVNRLRNKIDEDFRKNGFISLVVGNFGNDIIFLRDKAETFAELRKRRMWVWNAETVLRKQMSLMGFNLVPAGVEELSGMYDDGKLDGMFVIPTAALAFQWTTRARYFVDLHSSMLMGCLTVAQKSWDTLGYEQQQALRAAGAKFAVRFEDLGRREDALLLGGMLEKQGVKRLVASDAMRAAFVQAAKNARAQLDDAIIPKALVKEAVDTIAEYRATHPQKR